MWKPVTHNDIIDHATARALFAADPAPLDFHLSEQDLANAAAARYDLRRHVDRLNALQPIAPKPLDKA